MGMESGEYNSYMENLRSFKLYSLARRAAAFLRFPTESADDCAMEFVRRSLENPQLRQADEPYQWQAALNQMRDCRRQLHRLLSHEVALDESEPLMAPPAESQALRQTFWEVAYTALEQMPTEQRHAFVKRYIEEESVSTIAQELGKTANAVSQLQFRACVNMKRHLAEQGYNEQDLRELLRTTTC